MVSDQNFSQFYTLGTNWTGGWTYDVPISPLPGPTPCSAMLHDTDLDWASWFPCGDTTYFTIPDLGPNLRERGTVVVDRYR